MITYPRTDGTTMETASAHTAPVLGENVIRFPADLVDRLNPPATDRSQPEPGAEPTTEVVRWKQHPVAFVPDGWADPDVVSPHEKPTSAFTSPPRPVTLPKGTVVYRVIGKSPNGCSTSRIDGAWWALDPPPNTEAEWRSKYAVCGHWNGDGGYIRYELPNDTNVWMGQVAPQPSQAEGYVLRGGGTQIWVEPGTINPLRDGVRLEDILRPSPWNERWRENDG
ncbi:MAG: hypothetical protein K6T83_00130 [Alicyclobacillus sp.]|nr:hypothetical protein [Alicyclobacillus sp.]